MDISDRSLAALYADHVRALRERTDRALEHAKFDALAIFAGAPRMFFLDDQPQAFRPNPLFRWWTPLKDAANCWIVYQPGRALRLIFVQPLDYWHQPPEEPRDYWTEQFQIEIVRDPSQARELLTGLSRCAFLGEAPPNVAQYGFAAHNPNELLDDLHFTRATKTPYELQCIRQANERATRGHRAAQAAFVCGASEFDIHLEFLRATGHTEAELPYASIVALNEHAAVLHYQHQDRTPPAASRSFLIDAGAQFAGYAADVTRTYSRSDDEFNQLIAGVEHLQQLLCARVRPGTPYLDIHIAAHQLIGQLLRDVGLIRVDAAEAVRLGLTSVFFPHGIGHLLGLQVHDVGGLMADARGREHVRPAEHPYLRLMRTLEPGFVVTIEPGIYFIDLLLEQARTSKLATHIDWQRVELFRPYGGIRIEDDVACTAGDPENLTRFGLVDGE